ncbi:ssl1498 family light-harvesting-like protein [Laspinema sp. A4]|uniref:photosystem II assembly protein Psb34 n=1 Tax=Laspinema sp. D2d TaxID=2953686 RepID=UPI0021BAC602|nr:ssl1498 family light-harvesting-like protein [Laspinema sp. D2d]MCT7981976.1 ssl1498 family light-harvesting-like protein [Laspinema sp. D2d]
MYTTSDEKGILNNFATEPKMYQAEYPSPEQQKRYIAYGAASILLVALTIFTALAIS